MVKVFFFCSSPSKQSPARIRLPYSPPNEAISPIPGHNTHPISCYILRLSFHTSDLSNVVHAMLKRCSYSNCSKFSGVLASFFLLVGWKQTWIGLWFRHNKYIASFNKGRLWMGAVERETFPFSLRPECNISPWKFCYLFRKEKCPSYQVAVALFGCVWVNRYPKWNIYVSSCTATVGEDARNRNNINTQHRCCNSFIGLIVFFIGVIFCII